MALFSQKGIMEFLVRDYAEKYLGMKEPFELSEIMEKYDPKSKFETPNYTSADIRFCMHKLGLLSSFSLLQDKSIKEKELLKVSGLSGENGVFDKSVTIRDLIFSCDERGIEFRICKKCGRLFLYDTNTSDLYPDINLCRYIGDDHPVSCYEEYITKSECDHVNDHLNILVKEFGYYSNGINRLVQRGKVSIEDYNKWLEYTSTRLNKVIVDKDADEFNKLISWISRSYDKFID